MSHRKRWQKKESFKRKDDDVGEEGCRVCDEE